MVVVAAGSETLSVRVAREMLEECRRVGHATRRIDTAQHAVNLRRALVQVSRPTGMRVRTFRMRDAVVVARLDADIWDDNGAIKRAKLRLPD